jgi:Zn-dependent peptidase ImmA (M78 family)
MDPNINRPEVAMVIQSLQGQLSLEAWEIDLADDFDFDHGEDAYIVRQEDELVATLYINPHADKDQQDRLICHELLHLVLADMQFVACNGRDVDSMDLYSRFQERAINQLATAITGLDYIPIDHGHGCC